MPDDEGLREELARLVSVFDMAAMPGTYLGQSHYREIADAVLAVPAIAEALAAVERVRALCDRQDHIAAELGPGFPSQLDVSWVRRALDGEP